MNRRWDRRTARWVTESAWLPCEQPQVFHRRLGDVQAGTPFARLHDVGPVPQGAWGKWVEQQPWLAPGDQVLMVAEDGGAYLYEAAPPQRLAVKRV